VVYTDRINEIPVQTGDIICTSNGKPEILPGEFWRIVGRLVPGEVDHVAIFIGPGGRCVESGALGVALFDVPNGTWNAERMAVQRGLLIDSFRGAVNPLAMLHLPEGPEQRLRERVASYCLAQLGKSYNLNFLDSEIENAFYCSQLAYKAYQQVGVNLNSGLMIERIVGTSQIIFPQEIWSGFPHRAALEVNEVHGNA
jgi:permuted papain-like amidase YaeF/Yiix C92 family enzyme